MHLIPLLGDADSSWHHGQSAQRTDNYLQSNNNFVFARCTAAELEESASPRVGIRFAQLKALGRKVSDEFTVPLCRGHHREVHRCGDETGWWKNSGIDPTVNARVLWLATHPNPAAPESMGRDAVESTAPRSPDRGTSKRDRRVGSQCPRRKTRSSQSIVPHGVA
jgi:hypothetical protein